MTSDRAAYFRQYFRERYYSDPEYRKRRIERATGRKIEQAPPFQASLHHADEGMRCFTCRVPWPCAPFEEARRKAPRDVTVIYPEAQP